MTTNLKTLRRHVAPGANEGVGHRVDELSGNAEITNLNFALTVHLQVKEKKRYPPFPGLSNFLILNLKVKGAAAQALTVVTKGSRIKFH